MSEDNLRLDVKETEAGLAETNKQLKEIDKRLAIVERDVHRLDQKIDGRLTRRWDLWKLVLAAFLGGILTVAAGFVSRSLDRLIGVGTNQASPAAPAPHRALP